MKKLSEQLEPYKKAAIEYFKSDRYNEELLDENLIIVEPDVLKTDEQVIDDWGLEEWLSKGTKKKSMLDDSGILIEYVRLTNFVKQMDRQELIAKLVDVREIRTLEAKYSYSLHLEEKIKSMLDSLEVNEIHTFADQNPYMIIHPSTGEVEWSYDDYRIDDDCVVYDTDRFIGNGWDLNIPDRNIFCGLQFQEIPVQCFTEDDFAEGREYEDYGFVSVPNDDLPF